MQSLRRSRIFAALALIVGATGAIVAINHREAITGNAEQISNTESGIKVIPDLANAVPIPGEKYPLSDVTEILDGSSDRNSFTNSNRLTTGNIDRVTWTDQTDQYNLNRARAAQTNAVEE